MWASAGTPDYYEALSTPKGAAALTSWLLATHKLAQFRLAHSLETTDPLPGAPLQAWWSLDSPNPPSDAVLSGDSPGPRASMQ